MNATIYKEESILARFLKNIKKPCKGGCHEWIGLVNWKGYGSFHVMKNGKGFHTNSHRVSYMIYKGNIPKEMTVHHKCNNKKCVNPEHLELKTNEENRLLGNCWSAVNARKTHCKRGHRFNKKNTYLHHRKMPDGRISIRRHCKICSRMLHRLWSNK